MIFEFYTIEAGAQAQPKLLKIESATVEAVLEQAVEAVNARFADLVASNKKIGNMVIIAPALGEPCGAVVASECLHSQPGQERFLIWTAMELPGAQD
jgi:hypothetical protein